MSDNSVNENRVNNEKIKVPTWIECKIFESLLSNLYDNFEEIVDFNVENALAPGENYASIMLKVDIVMKLKDSTTKPISFMLKVAQDSEIYQALLENHDVFKIESVMYNQFVREFEKLYADAGVQVKFGAQSYELPIEKPYLLMENLKVQGFKNTNRLDGQDKNHVERVLKKLAQWHAASAQRVALKGPFPNDFCTSYVKPQGYQLIKDMFDSSTKPLLECIKEYRDSELYYDKVVKLQNQITDEIFKYSIKDPNEFNVLNHGDCWSNNIMFKYDEEGNIMETYFVDYQIPVYGSPVYDLLYFLMSSTKLEIKLSEFDYFIKFYHDHLVENLTILKYALRIPSLKEIHQMILKYGVYGYLTATSVMAAVLCDPTENATLDNFVSDSEAGVNFKKQMYSNARYRQHMEAIMPWLLYKGLLNC